MRHRSNGGSRNRCFARLGCRRLPLTPPAFGLDADRATGGPQGHPNAIDPAFEETRMKKLLALVITSAFAFAGAPAFAADPPKANVAADAPKPNPQQERMKDCNAKAADKKGDERKAYMKTCLSDAPPAKMTQQEKMKACNVKAADKKGDERKAFMSDCLKAAPPA